MAILLSIEPSEFILGILYWLSIIIGIIIIVKFFQISKDIRSIKDTLKVIAKSMADKESK